ncbi:ComEA family DNA-binding protein [Pelobacter propionicus]|uniref:DNA-binding protein n=1 Tax=Pelobacter propionicus (strain DSM 2379 / NBRC 103807 / OttBd1) TaxID=338966 RepID=A1ASV2_PELPD|nr:helix-hairpin-helix domain-containing protein [Pelobacter propionicus]ABL00423.1 conserved hypothetical protein [Pelobacter propionicus DSM 2379]
MKRNITGSILSAAALLLSTSLALAADVTVTPPDVKGAATSTVESTKARAKTAVSTTKAKTKAATEAAKPAQVDINSATQAELREIPGVGDTYAAKIIAGRPYANKSQLKTRNILPAPVYETVKYKLVAKKPAKK